jgi:hypothetical protein
MDFLESVFTSRGDKRPRLHGDQTRCQVGPYPEEPQGDPRYTRTHEHPSNAFRHDREPHHGHPGSRGVLSRLAQHKTLVVVAALLLLVVTIAGILAVALLVPVVGTLLSLVGTQDLPALLGTLLVDVPKVVLEYLAPFLQLKSTLEGKA